MNAVSTAQVALKRQQSSRGFLAVWIPSVVMIMGSGACLFTVSWWLSTTPSGGAALGTVIGLSSVVSLSSNVVFAGSVDRGDRRGLAVAIVALIIVPALILAGMFDLGSKGFVAIAVVGVCYTWISSAETVYLGLCETTAADLAPPSWPRTRIALLTHVHSQIDRIVAPVFAGLLIGHGWAPAVPVVAVLMLAMVLASVIVARRRYDAVTALQSLNDGAESGVFGRLFIDGRAAVGLVRRSPALSYMVVFGMLGNLAVFPFYAILPAFLLDYVSAGTDSAVWFSWSAAAYGLGMLAGSAALLTVGNELEEHRGIAIATVALVLICGVVIGVTYAPSLEFVVVGLGAVGVLFSVLTAVGGAIWLKYTPPEVRARVFSLRRLTVFSSIPLGTFVIGLGGAALGYAEFTRGMVAFVLGCLALAWITYKRAVREPTQSQRRS